MRYSILTLSAALFLGSVSFASAQTLRDDLDRMTGDVPASGVTPPPITSQAVTGQAVPHSNVDPAPQAATQPHINVPLNVPQLAQLNQPAPAFNLALGNTPQSGMTVALNNIVQQGPAVILFAPGAMAYTQPLFDMMQKNVGNFQKVGVQPIGVSTDQVATLSQTNYGFMLLSDPSGLAMRHYGAIKQNNYAVPLLVSINAQGVIVDMQETLTPDLNRAVRALNATQTVTAIESQMTVVTPDTNEVVQIKQVTEMQANTTSPVRQEIATISDHADLPQFPPVTQQVPQLPPEVSVNTNVAPSTYAAPYPPAMPPVTDTATVPSVPPAYVETQIQSY